MCRHWFYLIILFILWGKSFKEKGNRYSLLIISFGSLRMNETLVGLRTRRFSVRNEQLDSKKIVANSTIHWFFFYFLKIDFGLDLHLSMAVLEVILNVSKEELISCQTAELLNYFHKTPQKTRPTKDYMTKSYQAYDYDFPIMKASSKSFKWVID